MNPQLYKQLIYDKRGKNTQCGKDCPFNNQCWENWTATCKRIKLDYSLIPCTKINSKQIKGLNLRGETRKLTEESIGSKPELHKRSHGNEKPEHHNYKVSPHSKLTATREGPHAATKTQHPQKQILNFKNILYGKTKEIQKQLKQLSKRKIGIKQKESVYLISGPCGTDVGN